MKYPFLNHCFLICILILAQADALLAQSSRIRTYTLTDGLPQSQVFDLMQDSLGYIWVGTQGGGLCRFDGDRFTVWNERDGLISNYVHALAMQHESLFVGTREGLSIKNKQGFTNYTTPQINSIYFFDKLTYLATQSGIYSFQKSSRPKKMRIDPILDRSVIYDIKHDGRFFWVATNLGLWKIDVLALPRSKQRLDKGDFRSILMHQEEVLAASFDEGVFVFEKASRYKPANLSSSTYQSSYLSQ